MRKLTEQVWNELIQRPLKTLSDQEVAQLYRSNRGGSRLFAETKTEMKRRGLLRPDEKEIHKKISDYDSQRPEICSIDDLADFHLTLFELKQKIENLIEQYGDEAIVFTDAGYNNVSIFVQTLREAAR